MFPAPFRYVTAPLGTGACGVAEGVTMVYEFVQGVDVPSGSTPANWTVYDCPGFRFEID